MFEHFVFKIKFSINSQDRTANKNIITIQFYFNTITMLCGGGGSFFNLKVSAVRVSEDGVVVPPDTMIC